MDGWYKVLQGAGPALAGVVLPGFYLPVYRDCHRSADSCNSLTVSVHTSYTFSFNVRTSRDRGQKSYMAGYVNIISGTDIELHTAN